MLKKALVGSSGLSGSRDGDTEISMLNNRDGFASQVICGRKNEQTNPSFLSVDKASAKGKCSFNFSLPENWEASLAIHLLVTYSLIVQKLLKQNVWNLKLC